MQRFICNPLPPRELPFQVPACVVVVVVLRPSEIHTPKVLLTDDFKAMGHRSNRTPHVCVCGV